MKKFVILTLILAVYFAASTRTFLQSKMITNEKIEPETDNDCI